MAYFHTCVGCKFGGGPCDVRTEISRRLQGMGISSVKHKCRLRQPLYEPGAPVMVLTVAYQHPDGNNDEPPRGWFEATFIEQSEKRVVAFIKPGTISEDDDTGDWPFETDGRGYVKVPFSRVRVSTHAPLSVDECQRHANGAPDAQP